MFTIRAGNTNDSFPDEATAIAAAKIRWPGAGVSVVASAAGPSLILIDRRQNVVVTVDGPITPSSVGRWRL
jgi:hypothetical protein